MPCSRKVYVTPPLRGGSASRCSEGRSTRRRASSRTASPRRPSRRSAGPPQVPDSETGGLASGSRTCPITASNTPSTSPFAVSCNASNWSSIRATTAMNSRPTPRVGLPARPSPFGIVLADAVALPAARDHRSLGNRLRTCVHASDVPRVGAPRSRRVARVGEVVRHRVVHPVRRLERDRRAVLEAPDEERARSFGVVALQAELACDPRLLLLERAHVLLELAVDEEAPEALARPRGSRIRDEHLAQRHERVPVVDSVRRIALVLEVLLDEQRLAPAVHVAEVLDAVAVRVREGPTGLPGDDAHGAAEHLHDLAQLPRRQLLALRPDDDERIDRLAVAGLPPLSGSGSPRLRCRMPERNAGSPGHSAGSTPRRS